MNWFKLSNVLRQYYYEQRLDKWFVKDNRYLSNAFCEIEKFWLREYNQIEKIRFVMLSEAPLWGHDKKYIYNPKTNNTQFFFRSALEYSVNRKISDKINWVQIFLVEK